MRNCASAAFSVTLGKNHFNLAEESPHNEAHDYIISGIRRGHSLNNFISSPDSALHQ